MAKAIIQGVEYELDVNDLTNREAMDIEKVTGLTFGEFGTQLSAGSAKALTALVWTLQRRDNPQLRFGDVSFRLGEIEYVVDEVEEGDADDAEHPTEPASDAT